MEMIVRYKGQWVTIYDTVTKKQVYRCDHCGFENPYVSKYCPSCGARMDDNEETTL